MRRIGWMAGLAAMGVVSAAAADSMNGAVLGGLDKITARITTIEAAVDEPFEFGSLAIVVRHCDKRPPEEPPESAAFLEIDEQKPGEPPVRLFTGWMFASSPALSALEHAVYDFWVIDCKNLASSGSGTSP